MAYEVAGDVYFRAKKFPEYGKLSHQPLSELEVGASQRTNSEETARKEDPIDFALWKAAKPGEVFWGVAMGSWLTRLACGMFCDGH
jgi:Cysteinyl-tRNA synthetase